MRPRTVLLLTTCCAATLVLALLTRLGNEGNNENIERSRLPSRVEGASSVPAPELSDLDRSEGSPSPRTEAAPIPSFCERIDPVLALPETTLEEVTAKCKALEAALTELAPKGRVLRLQPGVDWKARETAANPDRWAAGDELFRLRTLEREMRYAEYMAARKQASQ